MKGGELMQVKHEKHLACGQQRGAGGMLATVASWEAVIGSEDKGGEEPAAVVRVRGWGSPLGAAYLPTGSPEELWRREGLEGQQRGRKGCQGFRGAGTWTPGTIHTRRHLSFPVSVPGPDDLPAPPVLPQELPDLLRAHHAQPRPATSRCEA